MIKDLVKGAVKGAAVWVGNTIGGPTGAAIGGKLADSLKGGPKGISGVSYGKEPRRKGGYPWKEKGIWVEQREFITAAIPSEKSNTNKIYKEFGKKFVKLLSKSIRKR